MESANKASPMHLSSLEHHDRAGFVEWNEHGAPEDWWPEQDDKWQGEWPEVSGTQQLAAMLRCSPEEAGQLLALKGTDKGKKGNGKGKGQF